MLGRDKKPKRPAASDALGPAGGRGHRTEPLPPHAAIRAALERQLEILALRSASPQYPATALAFIAQAHRDDNGSYTAWREHWQHRLHSERSGTLTADGWEPTVTDRSWSVVLLPVEPGITRASAAVVQLGRRARRAGAVVKGTQLPLSLSGTPIAAQITDPAMRDRTPHDIAMSLLSTWLGLHVPDHETLSLQAPVLEIARGDGNVVERELLTWELTWPLSAPTIDTPPAAVDPRRDDRQHTDRPASDVRPLPRNRRR